MIVEDFANVILGFITNLTDYLTWLFATIQEALGLFGL